MCWRAEGCKGLLEVGVKRSAKCVQPDAEDWFSALSSLLSDLVPVSRGRINAGGAWQSTRNAREASSKLSNRGESVLELREMPRVTVKDSEGTGTGTADRGDGGKIKGTFLPFEEARATVRTIKLGGWEEWYAWRKSGQRPSNIPANPDKVYATTGGSRCRTGLGTRDALAVCSPLQRRGRSSGSSS